MTRDGGTTWTAYGTRTPNEAGSERSLWRSGARIPIECTLLSKRATAIRGAVRRQNAANSGAQMMEGRIGV